MTSGPEAGCAREKSARAECDDATLYYVTPKNWAVDDPKLLNDCWAGASLLPARSGRRLAATGGKGNLALTFKVQL